jgi:hypothetical protein
LVLRPLPGGVLFSSVSSPVFRQKEWVSERGMGISPCGSIHYTLAHKLSRGKVLTASIQRNISQNPIPKFLFGKERLGRGDPLFVGEKLSMEAITSIKGRPPRQGDLYQSWMKLSMKFCIIFEGFYHGGGFFAGVFRGFFIIDIRIRSPYTSSRKKFFHQGTH